MQREQRPVLRLSLQAILGEAVTRTHRFPRPGLQLQCPWGGAADSLILEALLSLP